MKNEKDLLKVLESIDISVPGRIEGRKTEHTEKEAIVHFLLTYLNEKKLRFPLSLIHRDKPDFYLEFDNREIGIECTESIPEQCAWAQALWEKHFPNGFFKRDFFRWGSPKRSRDEIMEILSKSQNKLHGAVWIGKSVEKEWAQWMYECIIAKKQKLNNEDFEKFKENYLLIYDNLPQVSNDLNLSVELLSEKLCDFWMIIGDKIFTEILVESKRNLIRINSINIEKYQIPEL